MLTLLVVAALTVSIDPVHLPQLSPPHTAKVRVMAEGVHRVHLWASAGELSPPIEVRPGHFEAIYTAPNRGPPAAAAVVAWDETTGEAGVALVTLIGKTEIPIETEPDARVVVTLAGRKVTTRADRNGRTRVSVLVSPSARRARIVATDAAGNSSVQELVIELPHTRGLWLFRIRQEGEVSRVVAVSTHGGTPRLTVSEGGQLAINSRPGITCATVWAKKMVLVQADLDDEHARLEVGGEKEPPPSPSPARRAHYSGSTWELGAALAPRISGTFAGLALQGEGRFRLRRSRVYFGLDVGGVYAFADSAAGLEVKLGGAELRTVLEVRFHVARSLWLGLAAEAGGTLLGEHRTLLGTPRGSSTSAFDGGPTVGALATLTARLGPGLLTLSAGFLYSPLLRLDAVNVDGGVFTIGYRAARF